MNMSIDACRMRNNIGPENHLNLESLVNQPSNFGFVDLSSFKWSSV